MNTLEVSLWQKMMAKSQRSSDQTCGSPATNTITKTNVNDTIGSPVFIQFNRDFQHFGLAFRRFLNIKRTTEQSETYTSKSTKFNRKCWNHFYWNNETLLIPHLAWNHSDVSWTVSTDINRKSKAATLIFVK